MGWATNSQGPGYTLVRPGDGPTGAVVESPARGVTLGVAAPDLDAAVAQVAWLGGQILVPPTDNGWVIRALVTDPAGNRHSLIQDRRSAGR